MSRQMNWLLVMSCLLPGCLSLVRLEKSMAEQKSQSNIQRRVINDLSAEDMRRLEDERLIAAEAKTHAESKQTADTAQDSTQSGDLLLETTELAQLDNEFLVEQIVNTPRGSQVGINDKSGGRYTGTVLRSGPDSIELMNCMSQEAIPGPAGQQQCKTSHIPFQKIQTAAVTHFIAISPPPPGFPASDEEIDGTEYSVAEIVNKSGQRQRWGKPPVVAESH